jgi:basic membrane lipoprotein Med (substrate-binding protein (PBP1-ABC) superfamily)
MTPIAKLIAAGAALTLFATNPVAAQDKPVLTVGAIYVGSVNDFGYNRARPRGDEEERPGSQADRGRECARDGGI